MHCTTQRLPRNLGSALQPPRAALQNPKVTEDRAFNGFGTNFANSAEPIYGTQFLPRKFKVAVTVPGDNSVDLFTNDVGVVVMCDSAGELQGFNLLVGGGLGRTHRNKETFARMSEPIGYVDKARPLRFAAPFPARAARLALCVGGAVYASLFGLDT